MRQYLLPYLKKDAVILLLYKTMIKRIYPPHIHIFCICISFFSSALVVFTSQESGLPLFSVAALPSNTNQGQNKSLSSRLQRGCERCLDWNTKRGETQLRFPLQGVVSLETLTFLWTIALQLLQIVMVTKRLLHPMSVLLSYWVLPFIVQFCGFWN